MEAILNSLLIGIVALFAISVIGAIGIYFNGK